MNGYTPKLNLPQRKQKGLIKLFTGNAGSGVLSGFYYTTSVVREGTPMKFGATLENIEPCGTTEGALCVGLALQETYDETLWDKQIQGYHFANDTRQRLDGQPIGLLMGAGYAMTTNYTGDVAWGTAAYVGASGYMVGTGASNAKLPVVFEGTGSNGSPVRIRFDFPLASAS